MRHSFSSFLKPEIAENLIYKAIGIIKNSSEILNESFVEYISDKDENETSINRKSKIIDLNEIENSKLIIIRDQINNEINVSKEEIKESKKNEIFNGLNSELNLSSCNNENEFYLEIDNYNKNHFGSGNKSISKKLCSFNSSFDKCSENNNSNFNLNDQGLFSLQSPQRSRKNTVTHKSHKRLKTIFQNFSKGKNNDSNENNNNDYDKSNIRFADNKSYNQVDSN